MKKIYFAATSDLSFDQRMRRICNSLKGAGFEVIMVGREKRFPSPDIPCGYKEKRIKCWFSNGKLFYLEFNTRLFFYLLFKKMDAICAIDLDTILPCLFISKLKKIPRVYDAHELFCELQEVVTRPFIYKCWKWVEKFSLPRFEFGYSVSQPIVDDFKKMYNRDYQLIRNMPILSEFPFYIEKKEKYILYQGAVNEGRSFETLIPAMKKVDCKLIICGDGNFMEQVKSMVEFNGLSEKIIFKGMLPPEQLKNYTLNATIGITLFENTGKSNYYSLANRFFDYIHASVPQLCVNYPAYAEINEEYPVALLIDSLGPEVISKALNNLLENDVLYKKLQTNCNQARQIYNWQEEEKKLIRYYHQILN